MDRDGSWIDYPGEWVDYPAEWLPPHPADLPERFDAASRPTTAALLSSKASPSVLLSSLPCTSITLESKARIITE